MPQRSWQVTTARWIGPEAPGFEMVLRDIEIPPMLVFDLVLQARIA